MGDKKGGLIVAAVNGIIYKKKIHYQTEKQT